MPHWLFKTEPSEFGIADLTNSPQRTARWDGIRNYQARNFLRDNVSPNDTVWIYHSQCKEVGLVGLARVVCAAYPDPAQWNPESPYFDSKASRENPRWYCLDIQHQQTFPRPILLRTIKQLAPLSNMVLLKQGRLSIQPVSEPEAQFLLTQVQAQ